MIYINDEYLSDKCLDLICEELEMDWDELLDTDLLEQPQEVLEAMERLNNRVLREIKIFGAKPWEARPKLEWKINW